ncbi:tRNA-intron endonuclease [Rhinocladiella mackenziei CBS 650.93]|uniref:tRNA-splicing endonuclease subunit Sen34 n=1 Tax=Rhinocladiella mackenziei CBS 650.93 TaxID=1442369 RepID=A0A0D2IMF4_9EURO|nr:tRNA-intron endonuclease [Rhinocladiella mackenziei CBS 650.93]KIX04336.1 tRNA-intron endonuclease [Rhinocladiella mackenziei CBS 650.93]
MDPVDLSSDLGFDHKPELPVAVSLVGGRYLLFDIKTATYLRREHRICGVTIGTLPLSPSQNLFLGVPVEIMPEDAQFLVEKGIGFIVDDARLHDQAIHFADAAKRADYLARLRKQSRQFEELRAREKSQLRKRALHKRSQNSAEASSSTPYQENSDLLDFNDDENMRSAPGESTSVEEGATLSSDPPVQILPQTGGSSKFQVTPATSRLLLPTPPSNSVPNINDLPSSYPLYRYLHDRGFFMTSGLRFGCQYTVYPGDPLRFHSHFLAVGVQWDEEIDLMNIVGGGRLGTGVKKSFLLGGASPTGDVRTFSVEWAAM